MVWSGDDDVGYVKMRMYHKTGVRPEDQLLMWWGTLLVADTRTLRSLNVKNESIMSMSVKLRGGEIPVNPSEPPVVAAVEETTFERQDNETDDEVVSRMQQWCMTNRRMPMSFGYPIFVRLPGARTCMLLVRSSETILSVMQQIEAALGVPTDYQRLIYQGHELDRQRTLRNYSIEKDCSLTMLLRLRGGGGVGNEKDEKEMTTQEFVDDLLGDIFDDVPPSADTERSVKRRCLPVMTSTYTT